MKLFLCVLVFTFSFKGFCQADNLSNASSIETNRQLEGGLVGNVEKSIKEISGSYHLFKGWNNHGLIYAKNNKYYKIRNVNFNIKNNVFEYKNEKDSIIGFDLNGSEITINSRKFKSYYFKTTNDNKIFEVIYENELFTLLKDYNSEVKIIKPEGYKDFSKDKYIVHRAYYLIRDNKIEKFQLNKRNILKLLNINADAIKKYVKQNNLVFKKDRDLKKIFDYHNSL